MGVRAFANLVKLFSFAALVAFALAASGCASDAAQMPRFALPSAVDGKILNSDSLQGKALLINFFATWCPPCRQEVPGLVALQEKYASHGFSVVGISTDEGGSQGVATFIRNMEINYPVVMSDARTPRDFGNVMGIPTTFLVDRSGKVRKRYDGYVDHNTLERDLNAILK